MTSLNFEGMEIIQESPVCWHIPASGAMRVPGKIYASAEIMQQIMREGESLRQVINVAMLPGVIKYSLAMPDIHWGYGFPIGGVAATGLRDGVISPGGVGYDINCGVRLVTTGLSYSEVAPHTEKLLERLFEDVPTGVGAGGGVKKRSRKEMSAILEEGAGWCVRNGLGEPADLEHTEENGCLQPADPARVSRRALERGENQLGSLGSGNHFLELQRVEQIFDPSLADQLGIFAGQVAVMIHCGSRGLGHQVCEDHLRSLARAGQKYGFHLPDRQLVCAPIDSPEGQDYLKAMAAAANFAWANRQAIMHLAGRSFLKALGIGASRLKFRLLYDVCHNIAKFETHQINGNQEKVCVHRKGATRAFPPEHPLLPAAFRKTGQPVLIPGDMGRYSYLAVGLPGSMLESFGSSCHGAGRLMSRHQARKHSGKSDLLAEMRRRGVHVRARGMRTVAEEMPHAYKDVSQVVAVMEQAGISKTVARLVPFGVIKG